MNGRTTGYDAIDERILELMDSIRQRYHACTARSVAAQMGLSESTCRSRLTRMQKMGLVDWNDIPGSLRRLEPPAEIVPARAGDHDLVA